MSDFIPQIVPTGESNQDDSGSQKLPLSHLDETTVDLAITNTQRNAANISCDTECRPPTTKVPQSPVFMNENGTGYKCDTIYVGNLHPRVAEPHLQKLFTAFGKITRIQLLSKPNLHHKNIPYHYAFVKYDSVVSAESAINKIHKRTLLGKELIVKFANKRNESDSFSGKKHGIGEVKEDSSLVKRQKCDLQMKIEQIKRTLGEKKYNSSSKCNSSGSSGKNII